MTSFGPKKVPTIMNMTENLFHPVQTNVNEFNWLTGARMAEPVIKRLQSTQSDHLIQVDQSNQDQLLQTNIAIRKEPSPTKTDKMIE